MLRPWKLSLRDEIETAGERPLHMQIAHALIREIRRGRLGPGAFLPSSRELAATLGVNRKTVVVAYDDLIAQGWLETSGTRGTQVAARLPEFLHHEQAHRSEPGEQPTFAFNAPEREAFVLSSGPGLVVDEGSPDSRLFPTELLARAFRDGLQRSRRANRLSYGDPRGSLFLRESLAGMLQAHRGLVVRPDNICVTRGSQMAVVLAAHALVAPGDTVLMESLSYAPANFAFQGAGAKVVSVGLDADGVDVDEVERLCRLHRVKAIFLTPHHQFPTTVSLRPERRLRLIDLARQFGFAIVEDDYDHEHHFRSQPLLPIASYAAGETIYIGSLSKLVLPSLRIGYVVAPSRVIAAIAGIVMGLDRQGSAPLEDAVAELIESGELKRHARRTHGVYAARREAFARSLDAHLAGLATYDLPDGGLAFWLRFRDEAVLDRIDRDGGAHGLRLAPSTSYATPPSTGRGLRLGFASLDEREAETALRRLRAAAASPPSARPATKNASPSRE